MSDSPLLSVPLALNSLRIALFGLTIAALSATTLTGCQPNTTEDGTTHSESMATDAHKADQHDTHEGHDEEAHAEMAHDEGHDDDAHDDHTHEAHDNHDDDAHDDHAHDDHAHEGHDDHAGHDHAGHNHDMGRIQYDCQAGDNTAKNIGAFYHEDAEPKSAHLLIDGIEYDMYHIGSDADGGNSYGTEIGIHDGQGMRWTRNGHDAVLSTITLDDSASLDDEAILYTCHEAQ